MLVAHFGLFIPESNEKNTKARHISQSHIALSNAWVVQIQSETLSRSLSK